jgi:hypothetical protein
MKLTAAASGAAIPGRIRPGPQGLESNRRFGIMLLSKQYILKADAKSFFCRCD